MILNPKSPIKVDMHWSHGKKYVYLDLNQVFSLHCLIVFYNVGTIIVA